MESERTLIQIDRIMVNWVIDMCRFQTNKKEVKSRNKNEIRLNKIESNGIGPSLFIYWANYV